MSEKTQGDDGYEPGFEEETGEEETGFERQLRGLLSEDAYTIRPAPAPLPAIRRRGVSERRRRVAAAGAVLVTLAAVPAGAYALSGGLGKGLHTEPAAAPRPTGRVAQSASPVASPSPTPSQSAVPTPSASPPASDPARPASTGLLVDGISSAQAADGLKQCVGYNQQGRLAPGSTDLGKPSDYRILLAMRSTGDSNSPGDGFYVVAVKEKPIPTRLICTIKDGKASGVNTSTGDVNKSGPLVVPDINSGKLYQESIIDKGNWKLPFRWGVIGTVRPSVARLTVSYGDSESQAFFNHGWFVAIGMLHQQVTDAPHFKGYDQKGRLVYDSDHDPSYAKTLP